MRLSPILLSVALLCASGLGMAAESRQLGPDGDGNCPETAAASNEATDETDPDAAAAPARRPPGATTPSTCSRAFWPTCTATSTNRPGMGESKNLDKSGGALNGISLCRRAPSGDSTNASI